MEILKLSEVKPELDKRQLQIGTVHKQTLVDTDLAQGIRVNMINFSPGGRTKLHTHTTEQVLYVTSGKGIIATEKEEFIATPGTVAYIPAGERHWHGATRDSSFAHIAIMPPGRTNF